MRIDDVMLMAYVDGEIDAAITVLQRVLALEPGNLEAANDLAAALKERVPSLRLLSLGPCDAADADLIEVAAGFEPGPLVPPAMDPEGLGGLVYTGGTTGKPKGVMSTFRSGATMTAIQMAEWEWPEDLRFLICTPLSHAGAAFFIPLFVSVFMSFALTPVVDWMERCRVPRGLGAASTRVLGIAGIGAGSQHAMSGASEVLEDVPHQCAVFRRAAQPRRERHLLTE